ncbi:MAG: hypothetical protein ACFE9S_00295 [Candidatus Hermodarchaeota archaeon]
MDDIKNIIDDIGIAALETSINLAAVAVVADSGKLIIQTENWDLSNQTNIILKVMKGDTSFNISNVDYSVVETSSEGIIGTSPTGMGHILIVPFQGGLLVSYAMPQADTSRALNFLNNYVPRLNRKI